MARSGLLVWPLPMIVQGWVLATVPAAVGPTVRGPSGGRLVVEVLRFGPTPAYVADAAPLAGIRVVRLR